MNKKINAHDFALAVVSGNPIKGDSPDTIAKESLELYLSSFDVATEHNESIEKPVGNSKKFRDTL